MATATWRLARCDDGNLVNGDGCDDTCVIEVGPGVCGDGNLDAGEQWNDDASSMVTAAPTPADRGAGLRRRQRRRR
ncbi:MAG: hypothetical protein R3F43_03440 [bacterium]